MSMFQASNLSGKEKLDKDFWVAYLLILPPFLLAALFCFWPFGKTIINSFAITSTIGDFIKWAGFSNWKNVVNNIDFWRIIKNTFLYAFLNFVLTFFPSLFFAVLSARTEKCSKLYQTLYALPMAIAATSVAIIGNFVFRKVGLFNELVGTDEAWLANPRTAIYIVAIIASWGHIAGNFLPLMVGFRNVPEDLIEAATIDGAGWWTRTIRIMIPMASPQIFFILFGSIIGAFKTFTQIKLLTGGGPAGSTNILMFWLYSQNRAGHIGYSACISLILFVIIFVVTRIQFAFEKKIVFYQ